MTPGRAADLSARMLVGMLALMIGAGGAAAEQATAWVESYNSKARLHTGQVGGGKLPAAGIEIAMAPGWKTYWRNPGDSGGVPPHFDWAGSQNLAEARVLYPAPRRLKDATGDAVGYKDSVTFPVMLTPADPAKPILLALTLEYGICREICVPAEAKLQARVEPGGTASASLEAAMKSVPSAVGAKRSGDPRLSSGKAELTGAKPRLVLLVEFPAGATGIDVFVEAPEGIYVPLPRATGKVAGSLHEFEVDLTNGVEPGDLKDKTLLLTLVSDQSAAEATWEVR